MIVIWNYVMAASNIQILHIFDLLLLILRFKTIPNGLFYTENDRNANTSPMNNHKTLCYQYFSCNVQITDDRRFYTEMALHDRFSSYRVQLKRNFTQKLKKIEA